MVLMILTDPARTDPQCALAVETIICISRGLVDNLLRLELLLRAPRWGEGTAWWLMSIQPHCMSEFLLLICYTCIATLLILISLAQVA